MVWLVGMTGATHNRYGTPKMSHFKDLNLVRCWWLISVILTTQDLCFPLEIRRITVQS
jgi:hypothetical protein